MFLKDKYEISIWEDYLANPTDSYYSEKKIATIGSNTMTAQWRAISPRLVENINGTNTFTFKMYYTYIDTETGEKTQNPFTKLLVNERKIKVYWKNKWYDFIIKAVDENSGDKSITYTCKDLYINELSKTGFNLEFSEELNNNSGTVQELGAKVVEGTEWEVIGDDVIRQKIEEPVFEVSTKEEIQLKEGTIVKPGDKFLLFYSIEQGGRPVQVWYDPEQKYLVENGSMLVTSGQCYTFFDDSDYEKIEFVQKQISTLYRAERLVQSQITVFDELFNRYVGVYESVDNEIYYGFISTEVNKPIITPNLFVNGKDFINLEGWKKKGGEGTPTFGMYPSYVNSDLTLQEYFDIAASYIYLPANVEFSNSSLYTNSQYFPNGLVKEQLYTLRYKAYKNDYNGELTSLNFKIVKEEVENNITVIKNIEENGWKGIIFSVNDTFSRGDILTKKPELVFSSDSNVYIKEIELFEYKVDSEGNVLEPNSIDIDSAISVVYKYYNPESQEYLDAVAAHDREQVKFSYVGEDSWIEVTPKYNDNYEKIRSIEASKTNRFDIIQTLAETFECWAVFNIEHDENGRISRDENNRPKKTIRFVENVGQQTGLGFTYGLDLKTISRTIASDQVATKVIVSNNNNEFAENGFCSIARAPENYPSENFILNFDYYIQQGLLDGDQINKDLYLSAISENDIGYYPNLKEINARYDQISLELSQYRMALTKQNSLLQVYENLVISTEEELSTLGAEIAQLGKVDSIEKNSSYLASIEDDRIQSRLITYNQLKGNLVTYQNFENAAATSVKSIQEQIEVLEEESKELIESKEALNEKFNSRYSNYIQEGTWISEDYTDDTLYYLDAQNVAYTSSRPQISYNISVMRLSALDEYKNRVFRLGDIGFIQDVEFFGYEVSNSAATQFLTPYREKILISEVTSNFDEPDKDVFKVQNYKTQFEDLFQRIAATTQSLQYTTGEYQKVSNIVNSDGTIKAETIQSSLANNNNLVWSSINDTVVTDNTGVTVRDASDLNKIVKLTSGGLFISTDGGLTWKNAVRGDGVSTRWLTTGTINVNDINIVTSDGLYQTFGWDALGLSAYDVLKDGDNITGVNTNKLVRFDELGIYGIIKEGAATYYPKTIEEIKDNANYALTWDGFFLKTNNGAVTITSDNDIQVHSGDVDRVKIGNIGTNDNPRYGIRFKDEEGKITLETDDQGKLWLRDKLQISDLVSIGNLGSENGLHGGQVINANDNFIVYNDGHMIANGGTFTGIINATGGQIGNLTVEELTEGIDPTARLILDNDEVKIAYKTDTYVAVSAEEKREEDFEKYYIRNENNEYEKATGAFDEETAYFLREQGEYKSEYVFSADSFTYGDNFTLDESGLTVNNGTFKGHIEASSGTFTGTVNATNGSFKGKITAEEGSITGKLTVGNITLDGTSTNPDSHKIYYKNLEKDTIPFYIDNSGNVYAENITLGTGAVIDDYIRLGNALIKNPKEDHIFIKAGTVKIQDDGIIKIGTLTADGTDSSIQAMKDGKLLWKIDSELAQFNDIQIGGSYFKPAAINMAGGTFIFKDSFEQANATFKDEYYYLGSDGEGNSEIFKYNGANIPGYKYFTELGDGNDYILGVNGSSTQSLGEIQLHPNSFSIKKMLLEEGKPKFVDSLVLGNIEDINGSGSTGIGLYADNVFLNGFLTTKINNFNSINSGNEENKNTYAGVGTGEDRATFSISNNFGDKSSIVFWAGAEGTTKEDIQKAPFQVTDKGTLYASNAILTGSAFINSTLTVPTIQAAIITSYEQKDEDGNSSRPGLLIKDVDEGIHFECGEKTVETGPKHYFNLSSSSIKTNLPFIGVNIIGTTLEGDKIVIDEAVVNNSLTIGTDLTLNSNSISTSGELTIKSNFLKLENSYTNINNDFYLNEKFSRESEFRTVLYYDKKDKLHYGDRYPEDPTDVYLILNQEDHKSFIQRIEFDPNAASEFKQKVKRFFVNQGFDESIIIE